MKHNFTALATEHIDAENGIIRAVSLMEMGDAKGHFDKKGRQVIIDDVTLQETRINQGQGGSRQRRLRDCRMG